MYMKYIKRIIDECVRKALYEDVYDTTATPYLSKTRPQTNTGNPTSVAVGGRAANDVLRQKSRTTHDEENFVSKENIVISDNKFTIYKIKNFGNDKIDGTMNFFGNSTVELARAINTMNGAAKRNGKQLYYRTITSESNKKASETSQQMLKTNTKT